MSKPNHIPTENDVPPIKVKRVVNRRRLFASGLVIALLTFFATAAMLLFFALMFAPQLSNALWNTDLTQNALYGTSAAVQNAQIIVDMTSTALQRQAQEQQDRIGTLESEQVFLSARSADLDATNIAIEAAIVATQTAEVLANEMQRTQAAINYNETQVAINQQSTLIAAQATQTQQSLGSAQSVPTATEEPRPFVARDEVTYVPHPDGDCDWQGIAGRILNLNDNLTGDAVLQIRMLSTDDEMTVTVGNNLGLDDMYNWAIELGDRLTNNVYFLRLETLTNDPLSSMVRVAFDGKCGNNMAVVTFAQQQPISD